jgi:hypothetical protein
MRSFLRVQTTSRASIPTTSCSCRSIFRHDDNVAKMSAFYARRRRFVRYLAWLPSAPSVISSFTASPTTASRSKVSAAAPTTAPPLTEDQIVPGY